MKAYEIQAFGFEGLKLVDRPQPEAKHGEVLIKMRAWSLNFRDYLILLGKYNPKLPMPRIPLSDGVGEVVAVGAGVTRAKVGDRVAGAFIQKWIAGEADESQTRSALGGEVDGMLAEYVVLNEQGIVHVPAHLSDEEGATLPCAGVTAWHALVPQGHIKAGESVLLLGTGGVSLFGLQFAKMSGAQVFITSSSDEKLTRAKELGAHETINYKTNPDWDKAVLERTNRRGVDHILEVGGAGTLPKSTRAVRIGGHISLIGVLAGGSDFNPMAVLMKGVQMGGVFVGSRQMFEDMNRAIALHKLRPVVDRVFNFNEVPAAIKYLESGAHFGKVAIKL